jgi:RNase P subunit RPR2
MNCVKCNYPIKYGAILEVKNKGMKDEKFEYTCMECHSAEQFGFRGDQRIE